MAPTLRWRTALLVAPAVSSSFAAPTVNSPLLSHDKLQIDADAVSDSDCLRTAYLPCLDGVRALLSLGMLFYHSYEFSLAHISTASAQHLWTHPWLPFIPLGSAIVDVFFVMTGFLTALPLCIREQQRLDRLQLESKQHSVAEWQQNEGSKPFMEFSASSFYYRKFSRFLPLWALTYAIHHLVLFPRYTTTREAIHNEFIAEFFASSPEIGRNFTQVPSLCSKLELLPLQLTLLNNLAPFGGCQGATWSLGLQFQFLLFFPFVLGRVCRSVRVRDIVNSTRMPPMQAMARYIVIALVVVWIPSRVISFFIQCSAPMSDMEGGWLFFFFYTNTLTRVGTILLGVVLAVLLSTPSQVSSSFERKTFLDVSVEKLDAYRQLLIRSPVTMAIVGCQALATYFFCHLSLIFLEGPGGSLLRMSQMAIFQVSGMLPRYPPTWSQLAALPTYFPFALLYVLGINGGPLLALCICTMLAVLIFSPPASLIGSLRSMLEHKALKYVALISYALFLIHPSLQMIYYHHLALHLSADYFFSLPVFVVHSLITVSLSLGLASLFHHCFDTIVQQWLAKAVQTSWKYQLALYYARVCMICSVLVHLVLLPVIIFLFQPKGELTLQRFFPEAAGK